MERNGIDHDILRGLFPRDQNEMCDDQAIPGEGNLGTCCCGVKHYSVKVM